MNKLTKRLEVVASFIDSSNKKIIDIGCDHGYLSIFLANKYKDINIIASDINKNALESAKKNIKEAGLEKRIDIRLGSGIEVVTKDEIDTIIVAGMGSNTIVGFLKYSKDKLDNVNNIIVQSNTDLYFLRKNITNLGYYIEDEILVEDKNIIYTVIKFTKGKKRYSYRELYLGPILINSNTKLFKEKVNRDIIVFTKILSNIKSGHYLYRLKLKRNIKILKEIS